MNGVSTVTTPATDVASIKVSATPISAVTWSRASRRSRLELATSLLSPSIPSRNRRERSPISAAPLAIRPEPVSTSSRAWLAVRITLAMVSVPARTVSACCTPVPECDSRVRALAPSSASVVSISDVAALVSLARDFTSPATTAKPRPASPARAASMVALRARRLVCLAIAEIRSATLPTRLSAASRRARMLGDGAHRLQQAGDRRQGLLQCRAGALDLVMRARCRRFGASSELGDLRAAGLHLGSRRAQSGEQLSLRFDAGADVVDFPRDIGNTDAQPICFRGDFGDDGKALGSTPPSRHRLLACRGMSLAGAR